MSRFPQSENPFLEIGFRSASSEGTLQTIELLGVPGEKLPNDEYLVSDKVKSFFDDLIIGSLFRKSRSIRECDFRSLKIWLYDTEISDQERGYEIPKIDEKDLSIRSQNPISKLKTIYVLDNELQGKQYQIWEQVCHELFGSLFNKFSAPPELPEIIANNPLFMPLKRVVESIESIDRYGKDKQKLFFDALIIQVD
jgi:hypothetical protein